MAEEFTGCNYQWPKDLLGAVKELAAYDGITLKQELFEGAAFHLAARVEADPKARQFLANAGYRFK